MKKFILLMLLASGLSAHAVPVGNQQENAGQSKEGVLEEEVKTQAEAAKQDHAAEDQRSAFEDAKVMQQDHATEDLNQHYAFEESKEDLADALTKQFSSLQIQDPIRIETRAQQNFTNFRRLVSMDDVFPTTLMHLSTDEGTRFIYHFNRSIILKNHTVSYNIQPVFTFDGPLSQAQIKGVLKKIEDRKVNNPVQGVVFGPNVTIGDETIDIQMAESFKTLGIPVKVGVIADRWHEFLKTFLNNNPNNFLFDQWTKEYFSTVSPEKFKLSAEYAHWPELMNFFNANRAHLNPDNFTFTKNAVYTDVNRIDINPEILSYLTEVRTLESNSKRPMPISNEHFKIFLKNNANTLNSIDFKHNHMGAESCKTLSSLLSNLSNLQFLNLSNLNLSNNNLDDDTAIALGFALANIRGLSCLDLAINKIGDEGAKALSHSTLQELDLSWNNIRFEGAMDLMGAILNNRTLNILDLRGNKINENIKSELKETCRAKKIDLKI